MEKRTTKGKSNLKGKPNPKKGKSLMKLISKNSKSSSESEDSEHELSYYLEDRVKLMKEVLKIIKPKKIKSMAPKWMRNLEIEEINSMLFEELLGISNKRLKCIFNGQKLDDDSSSTDPEEEQQKPIDVISLDDVTDDDFVINLDSDDNSEVKQKKGTKVKVKDEFKKRK
ncbi:hypothetical protein NQ318_021482 [Aromia moschata]|uniref:Uncharacterized protein n=1 Tax=Aromia moschata TaxID=1265417 RepID=A0AAV8ZET7_9CUCU|nr:hypothetical protein NQ318_021482 [Aromia moschata]